MLMHFLPLSVVFLDVIQLLSFNNYCGATVVTSGTVPAQRYPRELADALKKWLPAAATKRADRKYGKNDKLMPLDSILSDGAETGSRRTERKISEEVVEMQKEIENAFGEQLMENYPEPSNRPLPDVPDTPNVSEYQELIDVPDKLKKKS